MSVLADLKEEIEEVEGAKKIPARAIEVIEIAKQVDKLEMRLSRDLVFRAVVQACFGKLEL